MFGWPGTPCGLYPKPAIWESSVNKLVTDKCSPNIKVGIGTQNPTEALDIYGHIRLSGAVFAGRKTAGYPANHEFKGTMLVGGNGIGNNDNKYVSFGFDGSKTFINSSNPANEGLYINAGSNLPVIIGSNNTSLTVHGSILIKGAEGFSNYGHSAALNLGNQDHYIRSIFGRGISLSTANASDGLILDQNGRIGIATGFDNIQAKVHIKASANEPALLCEVGGNQKFMVAADGLVYAQEIKVKMAPFPDYVFKEDYHLMSLTELQTFIKQNGRLPDMPSAEQVEKEGAELGELVRKLVEKNEQLTLYLLEMEKANKLLEERLKHLEEAKK